MTPPAGVKLATQRRSKQELILSRCCDHQRATVDVR